MSELRTIELMHRACDAAMIRRVVARLQKRPGDAEHLKVLLYLASIAEKIDEAFRTSGGAE